MKKSRFENIVSQSKGRPITEDESDETGSRQQPTLAEVAPAVGRPKTGKRSRPGFRSVSLWLKTETFANIDELLRRRRRLNQIPSGQPRDVSELAESLLSDWLSEQLKEKE